MPDANEVLIVYCTCPDATAGDRIARELVGRRVAACVNQVPGLTSTYVWEGALAQEAEVLLLIKTTAAAYPRLEAALRELHPYELPEILAVPVSMGAPGYLAWVHASTKPEPVS